MSSIFDLSIHHHKFYYQDNDVYYDERFEADNDADAIQKASKSFETTCSECECGFFDGVLSRDGHVIQKWHICKS